MSDPTQTTTSTGTEEAAAAAAPKKHKTVVLNRFSMKAPLPNSRGDVSSTAYWGSFRGNPRLIVHTNDPEDANVKYGKINANMDIGTFEELVHLIGVVCASKPGDENSKFKIVNKSNYDGDQRFDTPREVNSTLIGKDDDGRVWISVVEGNRPTPRFFFGPSEYHHVVKRDGSPVSPAEASVHFALATMKQLSQIMSVLAARAALGDEPDEDGAPKKEGGYQGGGQRQGGWQGNRSGNGGGGWQGNRGQGGGGWNRNGGGGGWQGNRNGGGGGWQGNRNGGGGGGWNRGGQGGGNGGGGGAARSDQAAASLSESDISF